MGEMPAANFSPDRRMPDRRAPLGNAKKQEEETVSKEFVERFVTFTSLYDRIFGTGGDRPKLGGIYLHFPAVQPRWKVGEKGKEDGKAHGEVWSNNKVFEDVPGNRALIEGWKRISEQEYKIHLMPAKSGETRVVEKLLLAIRDDAAFREDLSSMKVILSEARMEKNYREEAREKGKLLLECVLPTIVIYPRSGKEHAQRLLDTLQEILKDEIPYGTGRTPRFNDRVNQLIFYAQGDGDTKMRYAEIVGKRVQDRITELMKQGEFPKESDKQKAKTRALWDEEVAKDGIFEPTLARFAAKDDNRLEF